MSKNKAAMLTQGQTPKPEDAVSADEEIKDPFVLEFLDLKGEYSESDLEDALIHKLEPFLLELGGDFTFVGRQRRLRIGNECFTTKSAWRLSTVHIPNPSQRAYPNTRLMRRMCGITPG